MFLNLAPQKIVNEALPFSVGRQVELNHVSGSPPIGVGTDSHVNLFNKRTVTVGEGNGTQVGVGRVYDLKLKNVGYVIPLLSLNHLCMTFKRLHIYN